MLAILIGITLLGLALVGDGTHLFSPTPGADLVGQCRHLSTPELAKHGCRDPHWPGQSRSHAGACEGAQGRIGQRARRSGETMSLGSWAQSARTKRPAEMPRVRAVAVERVSRRPEADGRWAFRSSHVQTAHRKLDLAPLKSKTIGRAFGDMPSFYHSVLLQLFYAVGPKVLRSVSHVRLQLAYCQVSTS